MTNSLEIFLVRLSSFVNSVSFVQRAANDRRTACLQHPSNPENLQIPKENDEDEEAKEKKQIQLNGARN